MKPTDSQACNSVSRMQREINRQKTGTRISINLRDYDDSENTTKCGTPREKSLESISGKVESLERKSEE